MMVQWRSKHYGSWDEWHGPEDSEDTVLGPAAAFAFASVGDIRRVAFKAWDAVYEYRKVDE